MKHRLFKQAKKKIKSLNTSRDYNFLNFRCAFRNLGDLGISNHAFYMVFLYKTIAAMNLNRINGLSQAAFMAKWRAVDISVYISANLKAMAWCFEI
jgi:hypothetical protein